MNVGINCSCHNEKQRSNDNSRAVFQNSTPRETRTLPQRCIEPHLASSQANSRFLTSNSLVRLLCVLLGTTFLMTGCVARLFGTSVPVSQSDLVGIWHAEYEDIMAYESGQLIEVRGTETLTLHADGTYEQVYDDGNGNITSVQGNHWYLDDADIVHLVGGLWPQLGPTDSAFFADQNYHGTRSVRDEELSLDSGEAFLAVGSVANALGEHFVTMSHLGTGDPDSPDMVWFHKVQDQP